MGKKVKNNALNDLNNIKIDVVIPTINEPSLELSIKAVEKCINFNKIILVGPESLYSKYGDKKYILIIVSYIKNVGKKRALGLEHVTTEYYASIDSDLLINKRWYNWCIKTIRKKNIAACEGFGVNLNSSRTRILIDAINKGKDWQGLGNAVLKTNIIRKVGMPEKKYMEDAELIRRVKSIGYKWVFNKKILTQHLISDVDYWKHTMRWGEIAQEEALQPILWVRTVAGCFTKLIFTNKFSDCLFYCVGEFFRLYGYLKGKIKKTRGRILK